MGKQRPIPLGYEKNKKKIKKNEPTLVYSSF
jgi:hypothetical protein